MAKLTTTPTDYIGWEDQIRRELESKKVRTADQILLAEIVIQVYKLREVVSNLLAKRWRPFPEITVENVIPTYPKGDDGEVPEAGEVPVEVPEPKRLFKKKPTSDRQWKKNVELKKSIWAGFVGIDPNAPDKPKFVKREPPKFGKD